MDGRHVRKRIKAARRAEKGKISTAKTLAEARRLLNHPLPIGAQRPKGENGKHGYQVPNDLIIAALRRANGITFRALEYIRANGFPCYAHNDLRSRIAHNVEFQEVINESRMDICCDAVDALREAVRRGEDWAVRQVLNSPLANDLQLGQPSAKVAIDARSISVNDSGVLDSIDLQQRLARLGTALQGLASGTPQALPLPVPHDLTSPVDAAHDPPMDAAPLVVDAEQAEPIAEPCAAPSPPCSQAVGNPVDNPDLPTSHNPDYVSERTIKEPKDTPKQRAKSPRKEPLKQATKPERKPRERGADGTPEAGHDAAQVAAATDAGEVAAPPRKRGRPKGSRDSKPRRRRDPRRGKFRATGGGL